MSKKFGTLYTCERCGKKEFFDINKEAYGWAYHSEIGEICPKCEEAYKEMLSYLMDGVGNENTYTSV